MSARHQLVAVRHAVSRVWHRIGLMHIGVMVALMLSGLVLGLFAALGGAG